jgi:peptidoglycan/LPS O-acetylase OafA/YrhL
VKLNFERITSTGFFIPEVDGLRFVAIASVVIYHLSGFIAEKDLNQYTDNIDYSGLRSLLSHGNVGVPLFFVLSGFILGIPFAKQYLVSGDSVNLKNYYLRRLSRLEPPYILVLTVMLFGTVYVAHLLPFADALKSYIASFFYLHNFIYGREVFPLLNGVAWSLEIEVQFYIFAPILAYVFVVRNVLNRRMSMCIGIFLFSMLNCIIQLPFRSLIEFFQFFLLGFLLADIYVSKVRLWPISKFDALIGIICLSVIWLFRKDDFDLKSQKFVAELALLVSIFIFYYCVLCHNMFKFLSLKWITNIGGQCYSIYLLHFIVISMVGNSLMKYVFFDVRALNVLAYFCILLILVMIISSSFFLLIERPCMQRDWFKKMQLRFISFAK